MSPYEPGFLSFQERGEVKALTPSTPFEMRNLNASQHRHYLELYINDRGLAKVHGPSGMRILECRRPLGICLVSFFGL